MGDDVTALLVAIARENVDLRQQLALAQDMLVETAIDAGNLHALVDAMRTERDAWRDEAERLEARRSPIQVPSSMPRHDGIATRQTVMASWIPNARASADDRSGVIR